MNSLERAIVDMLLKPGACQNIRDSHGRAEPKVSGGNSPKMQYIRGNTLYCTRETIGVAAHLW